MQEHLAVEDQRRLRIAQVVGRFERRIGADGDVVGAERVCADPNSTPITMFHLPENVLLDPAMFKG